MTYKLQMTLICTDEEGKDKTLAIVAAVDDCGYNTPRFLKLHNKLMIKALIEKATKERQFRDCWEQPQESE